MGRGLKQGCSIAPIVYSAWTIRLCRKINRRLGTHWVQTHMSMYADDKHCFWKICGDSAIQKALKQAQEVITSIFQSNMIVNFGKSNAVIALKGKKTTAVLMRITRRWNGNKCLRLRAEPNDIYIPTSDRIIYLGTVLSYRNFESQTATHRAEAAQAAFATLGKALRTSGALRLALYKTCIWPALLYGNTSVGTHISALSKLLSTAAGHLRKILCIHEHGRTNQSVFEEAGLHVLQDLQRPAQKQLVSLQRDDQRGVVLRSLEHSRAEHIHQQMQHLAETPNTGRLQWQAPLSSHLPCTTCGVYFAGAGSLAQHIHQRHPEIEKASSCVFRREEHSLCGVPICRLCHTRLAKWQTLEKHISQGRCIRLKGEKLMQDIREEECLHPPVPPDRSVPHVTPLALQDHSVFRAKTHELPQHLDIIRSWGTQCMLCGQRVLDKSRIKTHWQKSHPEAWRLCHHQARSLARSLCATFLVPCRYCDSKAKDSKEHAVQCPALFQILSVRWLRERVKDIKDVIGYKPTSVKESMSEPHGVYYVAPIARALNLSAAGRPPCEDPTKFKISDNFQATPATNLPSSSTNHTRTLSPAHSGSIRNYFDKQVTQLPRATPADFLPSPGILPLDMSLCSKEPTLVMLCKLQHQSVAACTATQRPGLWPSASSQAHTRELHPQRRCASLSQFLVFRSLTPGWCFDAVQRDAAEYLHCLLEATQLTPQFWDKRGSFPGGAFTRSKCYAHRYAHCG